MWQTFLTECRNIHPKCFQDSSAMVPQQKSNCCVERLISHQDKHTFHLALSPSDCQHRHVSTPVRPAVCLSVYLFVWKNMAPSGQVFVEFCTCEFLLRSVKEIQFWLNLTDTGLVKIYISPFSSWVAKSFQNIVQKSKTRKTRFT
jgi:hypothetical protein